ncbi:FAD-dependent tricarballylate dehydrogenase TcuA [Halomarina halobia]|uniref:FAD-dependent tricarballylate dehydrogenase TcuA n=1 Tax=Halomarina halobia TaxID=3033386 RepID=A0ABD6AG46_9EURY|nr:FAD-dependent tricarballylate dehydrogenase TcuA [Halomarina sp. PSR21]
MGEDSYDVVVIGCGMAGLAAGVRAAELGRDVAILEKAPEDRRGGQTQFSESFRVPSAAADLSEYGYEFAVDDYTVDDFYDDIMDKTKGRADPELARTLVENAPETIEWLTDHGVSWDMEPLAVGYVAGRTWCDGRELVATLIDRAREHSADVFYEADVERIRRDDTAVTGVEAMIGDERQDVQCGAVVLACGGYESSSERRARYMGAGFDDMKVRGSRYNTGGGIDAALDAGAAATGQWSGAHMALIDANAPNVEGGANRVDGYQYGVILNTNGERFVDEGQDARAHTYAKFGREVFQQPDHRAYIVVDDPINDLVRATGPSEPVTAESFDALVEQLAIDQERALDTLERYNEACNPDEFVPEVLDGNAATDVTPPKTNWALPIDNPPYYAYAITGGITFTFGGIEITPRAEAVDGRGRVVPGLYAAGNSTGGLFHHNYPGGTGLMNAAVYGKLAAESADEYLGA